MPFPKPTLTDAALRAWGRDHQRRELPDSHVRGLLARGEPSGNPTFHVRKRLGGTRLRRCLGAYPEMSLKAARAEALRVLAGWGEGRDVLAERKAEQLALVMQTAEPETVRARWRQWREAKDRDWSASYVRQVERIGKAVVLPALGGRVLRATTREDWTSVIVAKRATAPGYAPVVFSIVASFHSYAEALGWLPHLLLPRRRDHVAPSPAARERVLTDAELVRVWHAADGLAPPARALVRLLILTGCRVGEVAGIRPAELDRAAGAWTLPPERVKNKRGYTLPLGTLATAELDPLLAHNLPAGSTSYLKSRLDELSGVTGWRLHDLRRTCRTGLAKLGISRDIAEACLNHVRDRRGLVGVYDRHDYRNEIAAALLRWHDHVAGLVTLPPGDNVVRLHSTAA